MGQTSMGQTLERLLRNAMSTICFFSFSGAHFNQLRTFSVVAGGDFARSIRGPDVAGILLSIKTFVKSARICNLLKCGYETRRSRQNTRRKPWARRKESRETLFSSDSTLFSRPRASR